MPKALPSLESLFDRTWRAGHPIHRRISALRRWVMLCVFLLLSTIIGAYWYVTDASRVKRMAESYLSSLLGGSARVGKATLSIFEGLRLDNVRLYIGQQQNADSLLFSADAFLIQHNLRQLLFGKIEATRIIAVEPRVHVKEDAETGLRNYAKLIEAGASASIPTASPAKPLVLPEIILRNAQIDYVRVLNGRALESNSIGIEGRLTPLPESKVYSFAFQVRGRSTEVGPMVSGRVVMSTGQITASLQNFEFGPDVRAMLPPDVRQWWEQHGLTGRLNVPVLTFTPPSRPGGRPGYYVEIELQGVTLSVRPEEWMGAEEERKLRDLHRAFDVLRLAGLNEHAMVDQLAELVEPAPLNLKHVHGRFIFSDDQSIKIEGLHGWLEEIPFKIDGQIRGYTPWAEAHVRIASSELHDIDIPAAPRYVNSLPPAVREIYDRFKPRGICRFWVELRRMQPGMRPAVTGQIDIIDGSFTFDRFPYPLRKVTGRILLSHDPRTGLETMRLEQIRGQGVAGGPNAQRTVEINGTIGPFSDEAAVNVTIMGQQISSEPALLAAFPPMTRKALELFDAPGKGELPQFSGDFACSVIRLRGKDSRWIIDTSIQLDSASGRLVGFAYPLSGVRGELKVHDDFVELINLHMQKGQATVRIDGKVSWASDGSPGQMPPLKPDLNIVARNVPIDRDLLEALPPDRRWWLEKTGAAGHFDLEGTIQSAPSGNDLDYDLRITLRDGTLWPVEGTFAVSAVAGQMRLNNQRLTISQLSGKRADASLAARGDIVWSAEPPQIVLQVQASNLALDASLYRLLPQAAQRAWDAVRPQGSLDAVLNYSGQVLQNGQPLPAGGYELLLTARKLSATPVSLPYRLDQLTGTVTVLPEKVIFRDMAAMHGQARIRFSGTGTLSSPATWDFALAAENVAIDQDLKNAVPGALADLLESIHMQARVDLEFSRLHVAMPQQSENPDVEFEAKIFTDSASMDVGVSLSDVTGAAQLKGASRNGKLQSLNGLIEMQSLTLAGRSMTDFRAELIKPPQLDQLTIAKMQAQLAGGSMAGQLDWAFPQNQPSRYSVSLNLRNADVQQLAAETEQDIQGQLSASLALEGVYGQQASRRGRGDVSVVGRQMYRIPLVLGLLQITNLSLPITRPFTEASARYSIDGNRVTFEQIEMRSRDMLMQGSGQMDFDSKQVRMTFVTDSTAWPKLPLIGDLLQGARHELLQLHVRGSLQEPKISARSLNTLTTTVDEVFRSGPPPAMRPKGK